MPKTLEELIEEVEIINTQFGEQVQEEEAFLEKLNENGRNRFNIMHIAFKDMETRFTNALDYLVPESKINNNNISNGLTWIKAGIKNPDSFNNYNITGNFSKGFAFLANLSSTMPLPVAESSDRLKEAARSLSASVGQYQGRYERNIEELETRKDQLDRATHDLDEKKIYIKEQWDELEKNIHEKQQSLDQQYSQLQSNFINNQTDRSTTFDNFLHDLKEEKNTVFNQIKTYFETQKDEHLEKIEAEKETLLVEWENHFENRNSNLTTEFESWKNDFETETNELLTDLRKKQKEAASIVGNVANNGIAGHFSKEAKEKTKSVIIWRRFTIGAFIATIIAGFLLLILQVGSDSEVMSATELISRLVVTAALGSLTAYLSKLASNDEKSRKYNSSMEIRLRTLNPYLDAFENEEQVQLKKELFPVIFREEEKDYLENRDNKTDIKDT